MSGEIAVVGMACRFPDAQSPDELWDNVLAGRRAFRRLPPERLRLEDYWSPNRGTPDRTYCTEAAVLTDYEFDRVAYRVAGETFRATDWTHWLALDVACRAVADAGFGDGGPELPTERAGVLIGNTLTGEFTRAQTLRLRWPYVARVVAAELVELGWEPARTEAFLERLEHRYKGPFAPVGSETLAGALSNTIAGRICNHLGLTGGGYVVDGACASSALAVIHACSALSAGDMDVALAGGVDLSLDPTELIGFAQIGALADDDMRVYDAQPTGFWPGEGCGVVLLMRADDAVELGLRTYALIRGWGIASDGRGGISRPEAHGQYLALRRAYDRAGFGPETVAYFEGHGTGTDIGDATELEALSRALGDAGVTSCQHALGTIKANIGHTKAAAGVAGLIKAVKALDAQVVPPTTGCRTPHQLVKESSLRLLSRGEAWPSDMSLRAGVSAFGFGGIDTHVVLEAPAAERRSKLRRREAELVRSAQDCELLLLTADDADALAVAVEHVQEIAGRISRAELTDLAASLAARPPSALRAAVVVSSPVDAERRLEQLAGWLDGSDFEGFRADQGVFLGHGGRDPRIGFLFPGQGAPVHSDAGALGNRFPTAAAVSEAAGLERSVVADEHVQLAVVTSSLAALRAVSSLGIEARVALGHSLGELTALHWAGVFDERAVMRMACARGEAMTVHAAGGGAMAAITADDAVFERAIAGRDVTVACFNSPRRRVVSGPAQEITAVVRQAREVGADAVALNVVGAFHSPLMRGAVPAFDAHLATEDLRVLRKRVFSTVTGGELDSNVDVRALLVQQIEEPVRFLDAAAAALDEVDLLIEVGPGTILSGLVAELGCVPAVSVEAGEPSIRGLLETAGAAYACGVAVWTAPLFAGRAIREFDLDRRPTFLANPCEQAPPLTIAGRSLAAGGNARPGTGLEGADASGEPARVTADGADAGPVGSPVPGEQKAFDVVRRLLALRVELPEETITKESRLLGDLHMNSITIGEVAVTAARELGRVVPAAPAELADPTVAELVAALEQLGAAGSETEVEPPGVAAWIRAFTTELHEVSLSPYRPIAPLGEVTVIGSEDAPIVRALRDATSRMKTEGSGPVSGDDERHLVVVCLPADADERHIPLLLEGARRCRARRDSTGFVLVQHERTAASFARSLFLEAGAASVTVVNVPADSARADLVLAEASATTTFAEAHYDDTGVRREPRLAVRPQRSVTETAALPLTSEDVLLVSGGGKGIGAECALALAQRTGAAVALLGRADPGTDAELASNLRRFERAGVRHTYLRADVRDARAVTHAARAANEALGPVTGLLHAAGANEPKRLPDLTAEDFLDSLAPKLTGLRNLVDAVDPGSLRVLIGFGSLLARTGMVGEANYALANEWMTAAIEELAGRYPRCRCLSLEWSGWSDVGMAARLGTVDRMVAAGLTPISPDVGIDLLCALLTEESPSPAVVVTGRFGMIPTLTIDEPELELLRFLERPRVFYPGTELIVDAELSADVDLYLSDHVVSEVKVFPAVMCLEAMAQVAMALAGSDVPPSSFEDVRYDRPITLGPGDVTRTIRVAALLGTSGSVQLVIRSDETDFKVDHVRGLCTFDPPLAGVLTMSPSEIAPKVDAVPCGEDVYGGLLFQQGRFRRIRSIRELRSCRAVVEISADGNTRWFGSHMPDVFVLGDPGARDAAIHAQQLCLPDLRGLPCSVDRIVLRAEASNEPVALSIVTEKERTDTETVVDTQLVRADGTEVEAWYGLHARVMRAPGGSSDWPVCVIGPYLERRVFELAGCRLSVAVAEDDGNGSSERAVQHAARADVTVAHRPDGKPEIGGGRNVSIAHDGGLVVAVVGTGALACDVQVVEEREPDVWRGLLGAERHGLAALLVKETRETVDVAATRVWAATECLTKAGQIPGAPLIIETEAADGWVSLRSGAQRVLTWATDPRPDGRSLVFAILVEVVGACPVR